MPWACAALQRVQAACAGVLDVTLVACAHEGLVHDNVTQGLRREALQMGLPVLAGYPSLDAGLTRHALTLEVGSHPR